uniref:RNA helicase n=1 Tax=Callorhinchus milii TaxID=7868 RepID=V9KAP9_CALMI
MKETDKDLLRLYKTYITGIVRPSYVLAHLVDFISSADIEQIRSEEQKSVTTSAELFLDCLFKVEEQGWFQGFLDGLTAAGYTGLAEAIQMADFSEIENLKGHKKLLERVTPTIINNVKPHEILPYMNSCLLPRECEEIQQLTTNKGNAAGAEKLLECLQRSDKMTFYKTFTLALEMSDSVAVTDLLCVDSDEMSTEPSDCSSSLIHEQEIHYMEQTGKDDACEAPYPGMKEVMTDSTSLKTPERHQKNSSDVKDMKLREYQKELARPGIEGKNTIICAPTGCGKTLVALTICEHHLKDMLEEKRKVVFLATTVPIYQQQSRLFTDYFQNTSYKVAGLCGESAEHAPAQMLVEVNDILIFTPQILLNCLKTSTIPSLSIFTLLIFDECHNTAKSHPYNVLMQQYLDAKLSTDSEPLPQIVGLTASIGVGDAKTVQETMQHIFQICANLDMETISTVRENLTELEKFVFVSEKHIREIGCRVKDPFADIIFGIMERIEEMARSVYNIDTLSGIPNRSRGTQKYEQWIVEIQKKCKVLQMADVEEERRICKALFTYTEHLRKYNDTMIINEDARTKDAVEYLDQFINNVKGGGFDETERELTALFEENKQRLLEIDQEPKYHNPKLNEVEAILNEEYTNKPDTKTILFVKTRALADALKKWITESPVLEFLQPELLLGRGRRDHTPAMTLPLQKEVLTLFKESSGTKLLIATSVADEGIDIAQCNLVLLYEYVGNVIKMIQTRGRGRAEGSKCILVTSKRENAERDEINYLQEKMMYRAIQQVQQMDRTMFCSKINRIQVDEQQMRESTAAKVRCVEKSKDSYNLLCAKCKKYACSSDCIRVIEESHHVVVEQSFKERYTHEPHPKPKRYGNFQKVSKLYCKSCKHDWGITANFKVFNNLPVIKIESFVLENVTTSEQSYVRKWIKVPFLLKVFNTAEVAAE